MLFSLEALKAKYGDALVLHYGPTNGPSQIIIDGGPSGVFKQSMKPRIQEMASYLGVSLPLPIRLMMVSHIDADHIAGILDLLRQVKKGPTPLVQVQALWHNSFNDVIGDKQIAEIESLGGVGAAAAASIGIDSWHGAMIAGVGQGRQLRDLAKKLQLAVNAGAGGKLVSSPKTLKLGSGASALTLKIIGPAKAELLELQKKWDSFLKAKKKKKEREAAVAAFLDKSAANLSSIVVHARQGKKTMLLTGDARGDIIKDGLKRAKLFKNGKCKVDILKVPHHGSDRNVSTQWFREVIANHYVISGDADAHHGNNPDKATLQMLVSARGTARYTIHMTYRIKAIDDFLKQDKKANSRKYQVVYPPPGERSLWIDLQDDLWY